MKTIELTIIEAAQIADLLESMLNTNKDNKFIIKDVLTARVMISELRERTINNNYSKQGE